MKKEYTFKNKNGKTECIKQERWGWAVIYKNNTELKQFDDNNIFHQIGEVEQEQVKMFILYKLEDPSKAIAINILPGMKLIHKYKNIKPYYFDDFVRVYVLGYKYNNQYHYNFILPNDEIIQSPSEDIDLTRFNLNSNQDD